MMVSAFVAHNADGILAIKRKKDIINWRDLCSEDIAEIIVPLRIFSGCGTTSGFYGYGKKTVYDKITKSQEACSLLQQIGKQLPVTNEVTDHLAHLNITTGSRILYNDKLSKSVGEARALKWGQMKRKSTS